MSEKRSYGDGCGIAHALDLVGERWSLLVVRELLLGPKRFTDLRASLPGVGPTVLAQRLRDLEAGGILRRATLPRPAAGQVYALTEWGARLEETLVSLGRWGAASPTLPQDLPIGPDSLLLSLRTFFDPEAAVGVTGRYALDLGPEQFTLEVDRARLHVARGAPDAYDARLAGRPADLADVLAERVGLEEARAAGLVTVDGDPAAVERLVGLFPMPATASVG